MEKTSHPSGPDLSPFFPKPPKALSDSDIQPLLPAEFDDSCKKCGKPMKNMCVICCTRQSPFATFQCQACKMRLFLFETPTTPLLVWSDSLPESLSAAPYFSEMIDERIALREHKREIRAIRYGQPDSEPA